MIKPTRAAIERMLCDAINRLKDPTAPGLDFAEYPATNKRARTLNGFGIDSLGVVELGLAIEDAFKIGGLEYTEVRFNGEDTVETIADKLEKHFNKGDTK